jgi:hypothetical protein
MTLAILTCSHFIYNSMRIIDIDALDKLSMCVYLARGLKGKNGGLTAQECEQIFPFFTWCVRDFKLELQD